MRLSQPAAQRQPAQPQVALLASEAVPQRAVAWPSLQPVAKQRAELQRPAAPQPEEIVRRAETARPRAALRR